MQKKCWMFLCAAALLATGVVLGIRGKVAVGKPWASSSIHGGPTLAQVRNLSSLVTLRAEIADVQVSELHGYSGGVTAALLVKGDVLLATDLAQARFESVDPEGKTAVLWLPAPQVQSARVDHSRTKLVGLWRSGLWEMVPGDQAEEAILNRVYAESQRIVETAGTDASLNQRARSQAEMALGSFFSALGWTLVIRWSDH
jgi:hypothetical protein